MPLCGYLSVTYVRNSIVAAAFDCDPSIHLIKAIHSPEFTLKRRVVLLHSIPPGEKLRGTQVATSRFDAYLGSIFQRLALFAGGFMCMDPRTSSSPSNHGDHLGSAAMTLIFASPHASSAQTCYIYWRHQAASGGTQSLAFR
jgi:hypothetical protein